MVRWWVRNGDKQFWKEKFHATNGKAQHALMNGPFFFSQIFEGVRGEGFFLFFPPFSQCVPIMFPENSQSVTKCVPQDVLNSTWVLIPYGLPKVQIPCI
jgi:hypothetical protein